MISAGGLFNCALLKEKTVFCWGFNVGGILGNGSNINSRVPVQVDGVSQARDVALGFEHTCVLLSTETVLCRGPHFRGEEDLGKLVPTPKEIIIPFVEDCGKEVF